MTTLTIEPVTRVEGHGKVTIQFNNKGEIDDVKLHVLQFRGFEKFAKVGLTTKCLLGGTDLRDMSHQPLHCLGKSMRRDPGDSHSLHSGKKVRCSPLSCASYIQSHALSFFHLSSPDLVLGMDSDPATRNIVGVTRHANRPLALDGIRLRKIGQQIIEWFAGKRVHPSWVVPGGVNEPLSEERRDQMISLVPEAY